MGFERGYVQVYTGNGKGKTTAALGLGLRACGSGLKVRMVQFMKGRRYSELNALDGVEGFEYSQHGRDEFVKKGEPEKVDLEMARQGWDIAEKSVVAGEYDLVTVTTLANGALNSAHKRVKVVTGQETKGIDFITLSGGSLSGHVYFDDGVTPPELVITAYIDTGYPLSGYYFFTGSAFISSNGSYSFGPLPQGEIRLSFSNDKRYGGRSFTTTVVSGENTVFDIVLK